MAAALKPVLLWILAMVAVWLIGFVMGRWSVIEIYKEAVRGLDRKSTRLNSSH